MDCEPDLKLPILFIHDPSQHLKCPVCLQLYTEPVINIVCGHTFCKACAQNTSTCPTDGSACDPKQVVVNRLVIGQIEDLLIYCRYGLVRENEVYVQDPSGCQQKIHLGARTEHESSCQFRYVDCSNSSCSARLRQSELVEHLKTCQHATCQYRGKGCEFESRTEEVVEHEATCGYRGLQALAGSGDLQTMENRAQDLEDTNRQLQNQVNTLNTRVQQLEDNNTGMQAKLEEYHGGMMDLKSKCESLSAAIEQLMTVRSRRSIGSPAHMAEGRPRSASNKVYPDQTAPQELSDKGSFRKSGSPPSTGRYTKWEMPFQFKCIGTLRGHQDVVWCMVAKDRKLYTAGSDCLVKVWDLENLQRGCVKTIPGHTKAIQCMAMGGNYLYTGGHDSSICCWNLEDFTCVNSVQNAHDNIISAMVIAGDYLFTSSFSLIKIWEAGTLTMKDTITGLHHWVRALTLNPERDKLFSGSHNTINIWSVVEPFGLKGKVDHQFGSVHSLAITDKYIIAGTYNRNVHVFRLSTYEHVTALKGHIGVVTSVVASYCGGFCISCSSDQTIKVFDKDPYRDSKQTCRVNNVFLVGTHNHNIQLFECASKQHVKQLAMHMGVIQSLATSHCGRFLFSASIDHCIQGKDICLAMHMGVIQSLATLRCGRFLFSASIDQCIQIWNLENMLPTQTLQRHEGSVNTLVLYNDFLFSGSEDKEIKVFMYFQMQMGFAIKP